MTVIGNYLNLNDSLEKYLQQIKHLYLLAQLNRHVPFSDLLTYCKSQQQDNFLNPLFQAVFVYEDFINHWNVRGLKFTEKLIHNETAKFDLTCMIKFLKKDTPSICFEYFESAIDAMAANKLIIAFHALIEAFLDLADLKKDISSFIRLDHEFF
jgi:hypothetical protein